MSRLSVTNILVEIVVKHSVDISSLNISVTSAKLLDISSLQLELTPAVNVALSPLVIEIHNDKYIHLTDIRLHLDSEKLTALTPISFSFVPPALVSLSYFNVEHRMLRKYDVSAINLTLNSLPTMTRYNRVNIQASRIPRISMGGLDIGFGLRHKSVVINVPLVTFWSKELKNNISGSVNGTTKAYKLGISSLYDSTVFYEGSLNDLNKVRTRISAAINKKHTMKTDIYLDYGIWLTRYEKLSSNISAMGESKRGILRSEIYALNFSTHKQKTEIISKFGVKRAIAPSFCKAFVDLSSKTLWQNSISYLGYTVFNRQVNYGLFVKVPNMIGPYEIDSAVLSLPLTGAHGKDLDVIVRLLNIEDTNFDTFYRPSVMVSAYGFLYGVNCHIYSNQNIAHLDITQLTKKHQELYGGGGNMFLCIEPTTGMIHDDLVKNEPFIYRMLLVDNQKNLEYTVFRKGVF